MRAKDQSSLRWAKRVVGFAGLTAAVGMTSSLALNWLLVPSVVDARGAEMIPTLFSVAAWFTIIGSVGVVVGFGWGRRLSGPLWTKGLVPLFLGLGLGWGWYLLNRYVDLWGVTAQLKAGVEVPNVGIWPSVVIVSLSSIATVLVWVGAIRVLGSSPEPAPDESVSQPV